MLREVGIDCTAVAKHTEEPLNAIDLIDRGHVDFVINVPGSTTRSGAPTVCSFAVLPLTLAFRSSQTSGLLTPSSRRCGGEIPVSSRSFPGRTT